jgi:KaiC/GvpD/RAD55 family RecA-like ATPase
LQLLEHYASEGKKTLYVSTRLSARALLIHQPWLEVIQGKHGIIPETETKYVTFQDSRRNEGSTAIANVRYILEKYPNSFVAFDSWEGLLFESPELAIDEISRLMEDYEGKFVIVVERREQSDLDYLVDGVIVLRKKIQYARTIREFELKKLRGVRVDQSKFLFSLYSGKHVFLAPFNSDHLGKDVSIIGEKIRDPNPETFSSGSRQLDSIIGGGFQRGSVNLLEFSEIVPKPIQKLLLRTVMEAAIENGHALVYLPYGNTSAIEFENLISGVVDLEKNRDSIKLFSYGASLKIKVDVLELEGEPNADFVSFEAASNEIRSKTRKAILSFLGIDTLEALYGADNITKPLGHSIAYVKSMRDVRIEVANTGSGTLLQLSGLADTHMRVDMVDGTPIVHGVKPRSEYYALVKSEKQNEFALIPVV